MTPRERSSDSVDDAEGADEAEKAKRDKAERDADDARGRAPAGGWPNPSNHGPHEGPSYPMPDWGNGAHPPPPDRPRDLPDRSHNDQPNGQDDHQPLPDKHDQGSAGNALNGGTSLP